MAFNVFALGKLKGRYTLFKNDHPDVMPYLKTLIDKVKPGASIEIKFTEVDGTETSKVIKLTQNDVDSFNQIKALKK